MLQKFYPENEHIKIHIGGKLYDRSEARISVFDSVVQGGDAVWEGLRVYDEGIFCFERHLNRLMDSAHALMFQGIPSKDKIKDAVYDTLAANNMRSRVHIRLTLTRGEKITSGMDPRLNAKGCCLIVLPEWKPIVYDNTKGISLVTSSVRRNTPEFLDSKIHHNNLLNNILAKIQANEAQADAALMLSTSGFVSETNDANIFMARNGILFTPHADSCLHGITRGLVVELAQQLKIECVEKNLSLTEFYNADEVFCTGTMGELTPVTKIDARIIIDKSRNKILNRLQQQFRQAIQSYCEPLPF